MTNVEDVVGMTSKAPVFSGNQSDDWTIWEMKMSANLMEKGLGPCVVPGFETILDDTVSKYTILGHVKKSNQVLLRSMSQKKTQHNCLLKLITTRQRNV
jgi:hypothetical protein